MGFLSKLQRQSIYKRPGYDVSSLRAEDKHMGPMSAGVLISGEQAGQNFRIIVCSINQGVNRKNFGPKPSKFRLECGHINLT
jgi:hypothetical protein